MKLWVRAELWDLFWYFWMINCPGLLVNRAVVWEIEREREKYQLSMLSLVLSKAEFSVTKDLENWLLLEDMGVRVGKRGFQSSQLVLLLLILILTNLLDWSWLWWIRSSCKPSTRFLITSSEVMFPWSSDLSGILFARAQCYHNLSTFFSIVLLFQQACGPLGSPTQTWLTYTRPT